MTCVSRSHSIIEGSQAGARRDLEAETKDMCCFLAYLQGHVSFHMHFLTACTGNGAAHSGLGPLASINDQNNPHEHTPDQPGKDNYPIAILFSVGSRLCPADSMLARILFFFFLFFEAESHEVTAGLEFTT